MDTQHRVVIVGGGFGGLFAARALKRAPVQVTLIDRRNFHLFQPLLYQVATGGLSPANIAAPLRVLLKRQRNTEVRLGEVVDIDVANHQVWLTGGGEIGYDTLLIAAGSTPHYFGHDEWQEAAPPLKSMADADEIRRRILLAFEAAELATDPDSRRACLTFVVVGGGTSGVELAGCLSELAHHTFKRDFRHIDPGSARIVLVEGGERVLPSYPLKLSAKAAAALTRLGVEIQTGAIVTGVEPNAVTIRRRSRTEHVRTRTILWAAGVQASPLGRLLAAKTGAEVDKEGRIVVQPDLTVAGHPELLVLGDLAHFDHQDGTPLPGVAPVAMQQGCYAAELIGCRFRGQSLPPFHYKDRGNMAVIGRNAAVADLGWLRLSGFLAWLLWLFVHLLYLVQFQNRLLVLAQWMWNYITRDRSALLIPERDTDGSPTVVSAAGPSRLAAGGGNGTRPLAAKEKSGIVIGSGLMSGNPDLARSHDDDLVTPDTKHSPEDAMPHYKYLIVGGGMTAAAALGGIREADPSGSIGLIGTEPHPPYDRPPLSKGLWKGKSLDSIWRMTDSKGATRHLGRQARALDPANKRVTDDRGTVYTFDKLLLATGSTPRRLPFGEDHIIYFRTLDDYERLRALTILGERFAIIGGGFIGSEVAAALAMNGKTVVMAFPEDGIGSRMFPSDLARFLTDFYRKKGVEVVTGAAVAGMDTGQGKPVLRIRDGQTKIEREIAVDGVVAGIGVQPNVELARSAGLAVENGIRVDASLRTSHPDIYAAGDVANFHNPALDQRLRVEHEDNANTMGQLAGQAMAGRTVSYDHLPFFYSDLFELSYEAVGTVDSRLETVADWKKPYREGVVYYLEDGRVRGVLLWNVREQVEEARKLIAEAGPFRAEDLRGRLDPSFVSSK